MMTTVLIDLVLVFWLLLFGGMALLPIITGTTSARQRPTKPVVEDRVISIAPARPVSAPAPGRRTPLVPRDDHHDRPAA